MRKIFVETNIKEIDSFLKERFRESLTSNLQEAQVAVFSRNTRKSEGEFRELLMKEKDKKIILLLDDDRSSLAKYAEQLGIKDIFYNPIVLTEIITRVKELAEQDEPATVSFREEEKGRQNVIDTGPKGGARVQYSGQSFVLDGFMKKHAGESQYSEVKDKEDLKEEDVKGDTDNSLKESLMENNAAAGDKRIEPELKLIIEKAKEVVEKSRKIAELKKEVERLKNEVDKYKARYEEYREFAEMLKKLLDGIAV